jgi:hypothetical protein
MLVNRDKKMIFIRIPKTACTSIHWALMESNQGWDSIRKPDESWHQNSRSLPDEFNDYELIAVSRNPWERMLSLFCFYIQRTWKIIDSPSSVEELSNKDGIRKWANDLNIEVITKGFHKFLKDYKDTSTEPCMYWVNERHPGGVVWFKYEQLDKIESYLDIKLSPMNQSTHLHYSHYYDNETIKLVENTHSVDIDRFGYFFEHA